MKDVKHEPNDKTRAQVSALAGFGIKQPDIAEYLSITKPTLTKYYKKELATGSIRATAEVAKTLFQMATVDRNVAAAIFWLKARAGWSERVKVETSGPDGGPVRVEGGVTIDVAKLDLDQKRALLLAARNAKASSDA